MNKNLGEISANIILTVSQLVLLARFHPLYQVFQVLVMGALILFVSIFSGKNIISNCDCDSISL